MAQCAELTASHFIPPTVGFSVAVDKLIAHERDKFVIHNLQPLSSTSISPLAPVQKLYDVCDSQFDGSLK
jgi:hypothetical protein